MIVALLLTAAAAAPVTMPDGRRLTPGDRCFVLTLDGKEEGLTRETIRRVRAGGRPAWDVVIHQSLPGRKFDMRDHFVLNEADLSPIAFDNRRDGIDHVRLTYRGGRVTGSRLDKGATVPIDVVLPGPVVEGNLWGTTFGALPLRAGKTFTLPFYHYDKGIGRFIVTVTGIETIPTPAAGPVEAWTVDVDTGGKTRPTYLISRRGAELGYRAGPFAERLGGDCSALD
jgi:hypothetical protein